MTPEGRIAAAWSGFEQALERDGAHTLSELLETVLEISFLDPDIQSLRTALESRLGEASRYRQVAPGRWLVADRIPAPPHSLRVPTVRIEGDEAVLIEAMHALQDATDEEGAASFTRKLFYREIESGAIRLGKAGARSFPGPYPRMVTVRHPDFTLQGWLGESRNHVYLYGLEDLLLPYMPGQYLRFSKVAPDTVACEVLDRFDEALYRSESRLFDLQKFRTLRRFGMPYRDHLRALLEGHPGGLTSKEIVTRLEEELGFRPNPSTIRGLLSAHEAFELTGIRWRLANQPAEHDRRWDVLAAWFEHEGQHLESRAPYRAIMLTVGSSPEPVVYSLSRTRPDLVVWLVSGKSRLELPGIRDRLPQLFAGDEPCQDLAVEISDSDDLATCVRAGRQAMDHVQAMGIRGRELLVDITGGTKVMSAGVALATFRSGCAFAYVGGAEREKGGMGSVISGSEVLRITEGVGST